LDCVNKFTEFRINTVGRFQVAGGTETLLFVSYQISTLIILTGILTLARQLATTKNDQSPLSFTLQMIRDSTRRLKILPA
jgi:hypothetical protein